MSSAIAIIPARYQSHRFAGKVLADRTGKPLIQHVYEQVSQAALVSRVLVATDDDRISSAVEAFGGEATMTRPDHPNGPLVTSAVFLLLFILLNPAPEVMYQVRHDSPLEVIRESYEFILENWIEWFLPLAVILAPLGLSFFFRLSSEVGRGAGLNFFELLLLPARVLTSWLSRLGVPDQTSWVLVLVLTPPLAVLMLLFRGHLFAALHGSSRRQRLFKARSLREE